MNHYSALLPILEEFRQRIEALEQKLSSQDKEAEVNDASANSIDMTEIKDYLEKIHMA